MSEAQKAAKACAVSLAATVVVNYLAFHLMDYPVVYCWLSAPAYRIYQDWGIMVLYVAAMVAVLGLVTRNYKSIVLTAILFVAVIEMPNITTKVYRLGGSCA